MFSFLVGTNSSFATTNEEEQFKDSFIVTSKNIKWEKDLTIFNNERYDGLPIIYPGISGTYSFELTNKSNLEISSNIEFTEQNNDNIPIRYKLKQNGTYIKGNETQYVKCSELNVDEIILKAGKQNLYTLEWEWIDAGSNDNHYGDVEKTTTYELKIVVKATNVEEPPVENATEKEGIKIDSSKLPITGNATFI